MTMYERILMQEAIDEAWNAPEGSFFRAYLFPDGKPDPETFVAVVSSYVLEHTNGTNPIF